jgi:pimeloyl-ACP methyl ester carboxylesterase
MPAVTLATGTTLSYEDRGARSERAVLLLPGPTDSWRSYERVLDHLPRGLRAVAVSQRGHGDSDKPESGYAVEGLAADAVALLDELGIRRAVLTGHSASCLVARRVAIDHPGRVAGLVLEASPVTLRGDARLLALLESTVSRLDAPVDPDVARDFVVATSSGDVPPDLVDVLAGEVVKVPAHVWKQVFSALLAYDDLDELPVLTTPTLLVWGDADTLVTRDEQERLAGLVPAAELVVYRGAGHAPRWEDPARFGGDVSAFARRCDAQSDASSEPSGRARD